MRGPLHVRQSVQGREARVHDERGRIVSEWRYADDGTIFDVVREYVAGGGRTYAQIDYNDLGDELLQLAPDHLGSTRWTFNGSGLVDEVDYYPLLTTDGVL